MKVKTYKTQAGAQRFLARLKARWPAKLFQIGCGVGLDFRNHFYVEVFAERPGKSPVWIGVGPMTTAAK